ncbi:hypothetical protein HEN42_024305, partial [Escherichia coli]|nr:hypothetical protein [Escherichia coli]
PPRIYRPDCQPVVPQRQLPEAVCGFRRPGHADQPLTAVVRCHGKAKPFCADAEIHGLRFQQFRFNQPQPGAVCLPPA